MASCVSFSELNNLGVARMKAGSFGEAFDFFLRATTLLHSHIEGTSFQTKDANRVFEALSITMVPVYKQFVAWPTEHTLTVLGSAVKIIGIDEEAVIFDHAEQSKTAAILLYNMGLCCHLKGLQTGRSESLDKAYRLYTGALHTLENTFELKISSDEVSCLIVALSNNCGHIKELLFDIEQAKHFFSVLKTTLDTTSMSATRKFCEVDYGSLCLSIVLQSQFLPFAFAPAA